MCSAPLKVLGLFFLCTGFPKGLECHDQTSKIKEESRAPQLHCLLALSSNCGHSFHSFLLTWDSGREYQETPSCTFFHGTQAGRSDPQQMNSQRLASKPLHQLSLGYKLSCQFCLCYTPLCQLGLDTKTKIPMQSTL